MTNIQLSDGIFAGGKI